MDIQGCLSPRLSHVLVFHLMLPLGSISFSSEQFNMLYPLKVIVVLCKYIVTVMDFVSAL